MASASCGSRACADRRARLLAGEGAGAVVSRQDQAREFILKGPFTAVPDGGDRSIKFDFWSDGTVFENTFRSGKAPMSSSRSWRMNDSNGKVCVEFSDVDTKGVCFGVIREGSTARL
jgi:hypothetical protein